MTTDAPTKACTKCHRDLPATREYFTPNKHGKYGLRPDCNECRRLEHGTPEAAARRREYLVAEETVERQRIKNRDWNREAYHKQHQRAKENYALKKQGLKRCSECDRVLPRTKEHFASAGKYFSRCHECNARRTREHYAKYGRPSRARARYAPTPPAATGTEARHP